MNQYVKNLNQRAVWHNFAIQIALLLQQILYSLQAIGQDFN